MKPPKIVKPCVTAFARQVIRTSEHVDLNYIACTPLEGLPDSECFPIVEEHANEHGGNGILGWSIWERPKVFIEAEFHMVWETPKKELKDITPRSNPIPRILFLHDPNRRYIGQQVDNIRKALTNDKDVKHFLSLFKRKHRLWNEGELADYNGPMDNRITPEMFAVEKEINLLALKLDQRYGPWMPVT